MTEHDISSEQYREYDFCGRVYRIDLPAKLYIRDGGTTHRVLDGNGVVHCLPAPGQCGCVLRWKASVGNNPVVF